MEGNRIPKRVLYMNLGTTRLRGRPRKNSKMRRDKMEEYLVEKGGRKMCITKRSGRIS